jgi:hypothetical protein
MCGAVPQLSHTYSQHCNELSAAKHLPFYHYRSTVSKLMGIINEHVKKYTGNAQIVYLVIILFTACIFVGQLVIRTGFIKPVLEYCRVLT